MPDLRRSIGVKEVAQHWVAAAGTGCFHFPGRPDSDAHGLNEARHEASEATKWRNRRIQQEELGRIRLLEHNPRDGILPLQDTRLQKYDINGKVFSSSVRPTPFPAQSKKTYWLCQVNGMTNEFNILSGLAPHPRVTELRKLEVQQCLESQRGTAGEVQPTAHVSCYDMIGYPPVHQRELRGHAARHLNLDS